MKTTSLFIIIIILILQLGCTEEGSDILPAGVSHNESIEISVINKLGVDLLDPLVEEKIETSQIRIYHILDGEKIEFYESNLDYPKGYRIYKPYELGYNHNYVFCLMMVKAYLSEELMPATYIKWTESDTDTIQCQIEKSGASTFVSKVWCNNKLVWNAENINAQQRYFILEK